MRQDMPRTSTRQRLGEDKEARSNYRLGWLGKNFHGTPRLRSALMCIGTFHHVPWKSALQCEPDLFRGELAVVSRPEYTADIVANGGGSEQEPDGVG